MLFEGLHFQKLTSQIEMIGDNKSGLYMLDNELGKRVLAPAGE